MLCLLSPRRALVRLHLSQLISLSSSDFYFVRLITLRRNGCFSSWKLTVNVSQGKLLVRNFIRYNYTIIVTSSDAIAVAHSTQARGTGYCRKLQKLRSFSMINSAWLTYRRDRHNSSIERGRRSIARFRERDVVALRRLTLSAFIASRM